MNRVWDADVELPLEGAARLIEQQFAELTPARLELLGAGWDNTAYRVNERFVFRFPRRESAVRLIERETRVLPLLAPHLPLPVPTPRFIGVPAAGSPYPFAGYPLIPGTTAWSEEERAANAAVLGRFLAALHGIPVSEETRGWAPVHEKEGPEPLVRERLLAIEPAPDGIDLEALGDLERRLRLAPVWKQPSCWVHGDLYARHLLVDEERRLCGVIDWGDAHLGYPALDLMIAFSFLPVAARAVFREAYGAIDSATWDRARWRALHYGVTLREYGTAVGDTALRRAGEYALRSAGAG
jgi:aminoglycoside phosphotransferase (APT) family kinase protein